MNALSGLRKPHVAGPISAAPSGITPDGGVNALSGLRKPHVVGPISAAPSGITPDGGVNALSGLRETARCRPDKRSAIGHYAGWRRERLIRPTGNRTL
ncbi:hypothetical protein ACFXK6_004189 [Citrobacter koseri]|nr:hypothetical protein [Citrobacter koseri]EKU8896498.1 hypothetical protein [Citrobacter koseri]HEM6798832.1 hypothetical protein [Citrobacter koseri]HEM6829899.1 hypothetical protein [Citrobacter koseri]HEM6879995.1 hypothetical protein [Citrobacter koseri]